MLYKSIYYSILGPITLCSDDNDLIGLWFNDQKHYGAKVDLESCIIFDSDPIVKTKDWLDHYFEKENPSTDLLSLSPIGTTFQKAVWEEMKKIPYSKTVTYGQISDNLKEKGMRSSPRAVGNAVSKNPISIIIPCHRVVGSNGKLIGYAAGIDNKIKLLKLEQETGDNKL